LLRRWKSDKVDLLGIETTSSVGFRIQNSGQNKSDSSVFFDEFKISETLSLKTFWLYASKQTYLWQFFFPNLGYTTARFRILSGTTWLIGIVTKVFASKSSLHNKNLLFTRVYNQTYKQELKNPDYTCFYLIISISLSL
jgi:hypothetical protein